MQTVQRIRDLDLASHLQGQPGGRQYRGRGEGPQPAGRRGKVAEAGVGESEIHRAPSPVALAQCRRGFARESTSRGRDRGAKVRAEKAKGRAAHLLRAAARAGEKAS